MGARFIEEKPPYLRMATSGVAITTGGNFIISWPAPLNDTDSMFDIVADPEIATVRTAGIWAITATLWFAAASGTGDRVIKVRKNAGTLIAISGGSLSNSGESGFTASCQVPLAVDEFIRVVVDQYTGANVTADVYLQARRVGAV